MPCLPGNYLKLSADKDTQAESVRHLRISLFSLNDKRPLFDNDWFYQDGLNLMQHLRLLYIGSSEKECLSAFMMCFCRQQALWKAKHIQLDPVVSFPYKKEYGDGILVSMAFGKMADFTVIMHGL